MQFQIQTRHMNMASFWRQIVIIVIFSCILGSCIISPYKIPIQQGNVITPTEANVIKKGMTVPQVENILGTPVLKNIYTDGRLVYIYTLKHGFHRMHHRYMIIYFFNGRVIHDETNVHSPIS